MAILPNKNAPTGQGLPPVFSFQPIPSDLLPGVRGFALTYHSEDDDKAREVQVAPNTVYALEGLTFVCATPEIHATRWRDLLAPSTTIQQNEGVSTITIGAHMLHWMTPEQYRSCYSLHWVAIAIESKKAGNFQWMTACEPSESTGRLYRRRMLEPSCAMFAP